MDAYIALNKYIVKETVSAGVGVPVSLDEEVAKAETSRRRAVASKNQWLLIDVPERNTYLDVNLPMIDQDDVIKEAIHTDKFLYTLFINEARKTYDSVSVDMGKEVLDKRLKTLLKEKYDFLMGMKSGQELIDFMTKRCINGDKAKVSALLWTSGINGSIYNDDKGERFLIFNAQDDIYPLDTREGIVPNTLLIA